jgi:hypothetical protein
MSSARVLYHVIRADFLERVRRYSFLVTLAISVFLGYSVYTGQLKLQLEDYRGAIDSAWLGSLFALVISVWIPLIGFYVVKNAVERDRKTRVGQILAATPMSKGLYTLGKALSNFAVLALMALVLAGAALLMALAAPGRLDLGALLSPIFLFGLTALAVTASLAVLFESLPGLRGGAGNVVYFFLWIFLIVLGVMALPADRPGVDAHPMGDYTGIGIVMSQMQAAVHEIDPAYKGGASFNIGDLNPATKTFVWTGVHWDAEILVGRLMWLGIAVALALMAALFFDRFDVSRSGARGRRREGEISVATEEEREAGDPSARARTTRGQFNAISAVRRSQTRSRVIALAAAELRLALKGRRWWWYAVGIGLAAGCLFAPVEVSRGVLLPFAWFWPVLVWSQMGSREARFGTGGLVFSAPHAAPRQLTATYIAGVAIAVLAGSGMLVRLGMAGDGAGLAAWCSAVVFIPALALVLGVTTGGSKTFEALYTGWWYIGPMHHIRGLDFMGTSGASSTPAFYVVVGVVLLAVAFTWRRVRLAYA